MPSVKPSKHQVGISNLRRLYCRLIFSVLGISLFFYILYRHSSDRVSSTTKKFNEVAEENIKKDDSVQADQANTQLLDKDISKLKASTPLMIYGVRPEIITIYLKIQFSKISIIGLRNIIV